MDNDENLIVDDGHPWLAISLYTKKQLEIEAYFKNYGLETFIPRQYQHVEGADGRPQRMLRPVVHNLLFVKQTLAETEMKIIVKSSDHKMRVLTQASLPNKYYLIPHNQMYEFRLMCNPEITMRKFLSTEEARLKVGDEVYVKFGPLKGLTGRLVRSSKKYYLLKEIPGISVMLKVSRWCCVPQS